VEFIYYERKLCFLHNTIACDNGVFGCMLALLCQCLYNTVNIYDCVNAVISVQNRVSE